MGIFNFFEKGNSKNDILDLNDLKFVSNDHIRYENGQDVTGHNHDCWRGIRVQTNLSRKQEYTVSIENIDGIHPVWGNNIQMAPKQMKIIEQNTDFIKLRGFGTDAFGNSFSDYGLTLHLQMGVVEKVSLHLHDRNVEIIYLKASAKRSESSQVVVRPQPPTTNIKELLEISVQIRDCENFDSLVLLYRKYENYNHPLIYGNFGISFLINDESQLAKGALIKGAIFGLTFPSSLYNSSLIDCVGQCLSLLLTQYPVENLELATKVTALAYIYHSRSIELLPREAFDSYKTRALLFMHTENNIINRSLIGNNLGVGALIEPLIISDLFFASQAEQSPHGSLIEDALYFHQGLDDISIAGKDADEYSLIEISELGEKRHHILFKALEERYMNGEFNVSMAELVSISR